MGQKCPLIIFDGPKFDMTGHENPLPQDISMRAFGYELPESRIAKYPLDPRDSSKLLIYQNGHISSDVYRHLPTHLPEGTLLFMNNTKVVEARLLFHKSAGSIIEVFCLEPPEQYGDITQAMLQKERVLWKCLIGGLKKWKEEWLEMPFSFQGKPGVLRARREAVLSDTHLVEFEWSIPELCFSEVLHHAGVMPLPPYLKRETEQADQQNYQTVYARQDGSVAAPTAGLHFTEDLLVALAAKNISQQYVTLHVGAGTFLPVKSETLGGHEMHAEFLEVSVEAIAALCNSEHRCVIAVGTTSLRTLESLYWMGVKTLENPQISPENLPVQQWDAYQLPQHHSLMEALEALQNWLESHQLSRLITKTQLLIAPGYRLRTVDAILTNFHQPQSTLLLLIHAFVGDRWKDIYAYAMENAYRFLSYGDGSLLWKETLSDRV